jgi:hypothetical protein
LDAATCHLFFQPTLALWKYLWRWYANILTVVCWSVLGTPTIQFSWGRQLNKASAFACDCAVPSHIPLMDMAAIMFRREATLPFARDRIIYTTFWACSCKLYRRLFRSMPFHCWPSVVSRVNLFTFLSTI